MPEQSDPYLPQHAARTGIVPTAGGQFPIDPAELGMHRRKRRPFIDLKKNDERIIAENKRRAAENAEREAESQIEQHLANETNLAPYIIAARKEQGVETAVQVLANATGALESAEMVRRKREKDLVQFSGWITGKPAFEQRRLVGPKRFERLVGLAGLGAVDFSELRPVRIDDGDDDAEFSFSWAPPEGDDLPVTFTEWLESISDENALLVLGEERFEQWHKGELDLRPLVAVTPDGTRHVLEISTEAIPMLDEYFARRLLSVEPEPVVEEKKPEPEKLPDESKGPDSESTSTETAEKGPELIENESNSGSVESTDNAGTVTEGAQEGDTAVEGNSAAEQSAEAAGDTASAQQTTNAPEVPEPSGKGKGRGSKNK